MTTATRQRAGRDLIEAYLPGVLVEQWAADPRAPTTWHHWLEGSLMLCDITGFTAMSERLARHGKEGAELMAGILNTFFARMLDIAADQGGVQMKFGGDAMLLLFTGEEHASRAVASGLRMQGAMGEFGHVQAGGEQHRLRMRIGVHSGRFFSASAGEPEGVLHYLFLGADVNRTAAVEGVTQPGQVVVSEQTAGRIRPVASLAKGERGTWRVRSIEQPQPPAVVRNGAHVPDAMLRRYLLPPIAQQLAAGRVPDFPPEHRRVTAMFINVLGTAELLADDGDDETLRQIDAYLRVVLAQLERHGGFLIGSDAADHGEKLIALFGAPVASEREDISALRCALDIDRDAAAAGLSLKHRIGISTGFAFAGEIGSVRRREYTVIGDTVNLAARLMTAASPGQIIISGPTAERSKAEFELKKLRPLTLKGKSKPVPAFRLEGLRVAPLPHELSITPELVGRETELAALLRVSRETARGKARWAFVAGDPGIGKSRLIADVAERLRGDGWQTLEAYCQPYRARAVFSAWVEPLRGLLGIADDSPAQAWQKMRAEAGRLPGVLPTYAPLLAEVLSVPAPDEPMLRFLDARTRRQHLAAAVIGLLKAAAARNPLFLLFEDVHIADAPSMELLAEVLSSGDTRVMVCLTSREQAPPSELSRQKASLRLRLSELTASDARRLAASGARLSDGDVDTIVAKAQGNPLFLQEMALSGLPRDGAMPRTIDEVILARVDRLSGDERAVLRAAAVAGTAFRLTHVETLIGDSLPRRGVRRAVDELVQRGFMRPHAEETSTHAFTHLLTQEVVYETLPYAQRRQMHRTVAVSLEEEYTGTLERVCAVLLHHAASASDAARTVRYATMSGDRAASVFAVQQAIDYYERGLQALAQLPGESPADRSTLLERVGDSLETAGRHRAAQQAFVDALNEWWAARRAARRRKRLLAVSVPDATRESHLCRRVGVASERSSDYDVALEWLDLALEKLPPRGGQVGAQIFASRSVTLFRKGQYGEAISWGRRAVAMARRTRDDRAIAYAQNMLGNAYVAEGNMRTAVRYLLPAVETYHRIEDVSGQAAANNNLGICYQNLGDLARAIHHYRFALESDMKVGDLVDAAICHNNIAEVLLLQGDLDEAIGHLEQVLRAQKSDPELTAVAGLSHVNISRCRLAQGKLALAAEHLQQGTRMLRRVGAEGLVLEAQIQLAELQVARKQPREGLAGARKALVAAQATEARMLESRALRVIGAALTALRRPAEATALLLESAAVAHKIGAGYEEARALISLVRAGEASGAAGPGMEARARRAVAILEPMGAKLDLADARALLVSPSAARRARTAGTSRRPGASKRRQPKASRA